MPNKNHNDKAPEKVTRKRPEDGTNTMHDNDEREPARKPELVPPGTMPEDEDIEQGTPVRNPNVVLPDVEGVSGPGDGRDGVDPSDATDDPDRIGGKPQPPRRG